MGRVYLHRRSGCRRSSRRYTPRFVCDPQRLAAIGSSGTFQVSLLRVLRDYAASAHSPDENRSAATAATPHPKQHLDVNFVFEIRLYKEVSGKKKSVQVLRKRVCRCCLRRLDNSQWRSSARITAFAILKDRCAVSAFVLVPMVAETQKPEANLIHQLTCRRTRGLPPVTRRRKLRPEIAPVSASSNNRSVEARSPRKPTPEGN